MSGSVQRPTKIAGSSLLQRRVTVDSATVKRLSSSSSESRLAVRSSSLRGPASASLSGGFQRQASERGSRELAPLEQKDKLLRQSSPSDELKEKIAKERELRAANGSTEPPSIRAIRLARKYGIDMYEVKLVLEALEKVTKTSEGRLTKKDLTNFLSNAFQADSVPEDVVDHIYKISCTDSKGNEQEFDLPAFLDWYFINLFSKVAMLRSSPRALESHKLTASLCERFKLESIQLDKVKKTFDRFDADNSGIIDRDEFEEMVVSLCGGTKGDYSQERLASFWREIDKDGSGEVDFAEFTEWYLKYFNVGQGLGCNPNQQFYASFSPSVQRQEFLSRAEEVGIA
eukprot:TRINITY_DN11296_c0_g1_i1.p1 TRINITY_DN11296_c0_g1~~TRINITY_DN11296_c0_g1_i1.p1  ORF type:complete len:343 (+),score=78.72 TRINITY_DN11296_c0_g1_i1:62-1090(+)